MIIDIFSDLMVIKSEKLYLKLQIAQMSSLKMLLSKYYENLSMVFSQRPFSTLGSRSSLNLDSVIKQLTLSKYRVLRRLNSLVCPLALHCNKYSLRKVEFTSFLKFYVFLIFILRTYFSNFENYLENSS